MKNRFETIGKVKIHYIIEGEGPSLLFLHGHRSDSLRFKGVIEKLAEKYQVFAPDLPGFGKSSQLPVWHSLENYRKYLLLFVEKIGLTDFVLAGASMGGSLSILLAQKIPQKIKRIVLFGAVYDRRCFKLRRLKRLFIILALAVFPRNGYLVFLVDKMIRNDFLFKRFLAHHFPKEAQKKEIVNFEVKQWRTSSIKIWAQTLFSLLTFRLKDKKEISLPTLLIFSEKDQYIDVEKNISGLKKIFPRSELIIIKGIAHVPKGDITQDLLSKLDWVFAKV